ASFTVSRSLNCRSASKIHERSMRISGAGPRGSFGNKPVPVTTNRGMPRAWYSGVVGRISDSCHTGLEPNGSAAARGRYNTSIPPGGLQCDLASTCSAMMESTFRNACFNSSTTVASASKILIEYFTWCLPYYCWDSSWQVGIRDDEPRSFSQRIDVAANSGCRKLPSDNSVVA